MDSMNVYSFNFKQFGFWELVHLKSQIFNAPNIFHLEYSAVRPHLVLCVAFKPPGSSGKDVLTTWLEHSIMVITIFLFCRREAPRRFNLENCSALKS